MPFYKYQNLLIQKDDVDVDTKEYWSDYWQNNSDDRKDIFIEFNDAFNKLLYPENVLEKENRKNIKILEVGCGDGRYVKELIKQGYDSVGIDMVRTGMKDDNIKFVQGDIEYLPFKENSFDVCVLIGVLGYFINPSKLLIEVNRVLKYFGFIVLRFVCLTLNKRISQHLENEESQSIILHDEPKGVFTCYHDITSVLSFASNLNWELFCLTPDINSQFTASMIENELGERMIITDYDEVAMSFRKVYF